jgi:hypothetical protein
LERELKVLTAKHESEIKALTQPVAKVDTTSQSNQSLDVSQLTSKLEAERTATKALEQRKGILEAELKISFY